MAKAYVVTAGSYSDYSILRVFSSLDAAEQFRKSYDTRYGDYGATNDIEEYDLLDYDPGMWEEFHLSGYVEGPARGEGSIHTVFQSFSQWRIGPAPIRPTVHIRGIYTYPEKEPWIEREKVGLKQVQIRGSGWHAQDVKKAVEELAVQVEAGWSVYQMKEDF